MKVWELIQSLEQCEAGAFVQVVIVYRRSDKGIEGKDLLHRESLECLKSKKGVVELACVLNPRLAICPYDNPTKEQGHE